MKPKEKKIEAILNCLKKQPATAPELARLTNTNVGYVYSLLYLLEARGLVKRDWFGAWVWKIRERTPLLKPPKKSRNSRGGVSPREKW